MSKLGFLAISMCYLLTFCTYNSVSAQTFTGATNSNWNTASNWTPAAVPSGVTTNVAMSASATITSGITVNIGSITTNVTGTTFTVNGGSTLNVGSSGTGANMTFSNGGGLAISGGSTVTIYGNLNITGNFNLNVSGNSKLIIKGNVTISGGASLSLSGTGVVTVSGSLTGGNNSSITASGGGTSLNVANSITLGNSSTINVSGSASITANSVSVGSGSCETVDNSGSAITTSKGSCQNTSSCTSCSTILPVTLAGFYSSLKATSIDLNWSTATELNFDYFSLQKSADGKIFYEIAQVQGHGTTNVPHNYSYEDKSPFIGKNYYRLTSVDFDNYQETFKVVEQDYTGAKDFSVSPNPTDGTSVTFNINFEEANGNVTIYDQLGLPITSYQVNETTNVLFATPMKSGIYLARYSSPVFSKTVRFVVK